ncbi:MAG: heme lyase CcmF/NrfE family subunit [Acidobacteriota bacterium]|nr:MAG: heme lyase CcmF/NrfE family subunit [Acidobacteriota bacterium]
MIPTLGSFLLLLAFLVCAYGVTVAFSGAALRHHAAVRSGEHAVHVVTWLTVLASLCLWHAFLTHDFSVDYVAQYSNRSLPMFFTFASFWAGQSGSLLFWLLVLSICGTLVVLQNRRRNRVLMPYVTGILLVLALFFLVLLNFAASPFERLDPAPADGRGLNPLLQHPAMAVHPPTLFLGYVGLSVPFAFALASLIAGKMDGDWLRSIRRWTLVTWTFLSVGVVLGGLWAYHELGWGGYWGWDPVENASLMPWFLSTAFLHSIMVQERRDMFRVWNMGLIVGAFLLTLYGTFITRSGILSSVHSFALSTVGPYFVGFLLLVTLYSFGMLFYRTPRLRAVGKLDSMVSRESSFLLNNVFLLAIALAVLVGTIWPFITEAVKGVKVSVGAPFFNFVVPPIALGLLLLTGVGPLLAWRAMSWRHLGRTLAVPGVGFLATLVGLRLGGVTAWYANVFLASCALTLLSVAVEFHRGARARREMAGESHGAALWRLLRKNGRRYGGYIVHVGIVAIFAAITCSHAFKEEAEAVLYEGEAMQIRGYTLAYRGIESTPVNPDVTETVATLDVSRGEKQLGPMKPSVMFYTYWEQPSTEVAIRSTLVEDLYVILVSWGAGGEHATFRVFVNPLVTWLWLGVAVMVLGIVFCLLPKPRQAEGRPRQAEGEPAASLPEERS